MLAQQHPSALLSDYVLDLLPATKRKKIERHLAKCDTCLQQVRRERAMARTLRNTLRDTPAVAPQRLAELMPAPPQRQRPLSWKVLWRPALALSLFLVIFLGGMHVQRYPGGALAYPSATVLSATATMTPTATVAGGTAEPATELQAVPGEAPVARPAGTPVASLELPAQ